MSMPSSLEIAQAARLRPVAELAAELGLEPDEVELHGPYKAKIRLEALERLAQRGVSDAKFFPHLLAAHRLVCGIEQLQDPIVKIWGGRHPVFDTFIFGQNFKMRRGPFDKLESHGLERRCRSMLDCHLDR